MKGAVFGLLSRVRWSGGPLCLRVSEAVAPSARSVPYGPDALPLTLNQNRSKRIWLQKRDSLSCRTKVLGGARKVKSPMPSFG